MYSSIYKLLPLPRLVNSHAGTSPFSCPYLSVGRIRSDNRSQLRLPLVSVGKQFLCSYKVSSYKLATPGPSA